MIGYLEGTIRQLDANHAVVVAGGVGYLVNIPASTFYKLDGQKTASLQIYTHVREDIIALYGFATEEEKFFGNGGFSRVRVTDNGEGTALLYFFLVVLFHVPLPHLNVFQVV